MKRSDGFTLIELMIVVAIIGILAAIAIPKFAMLLRKSKEGASKGNLGALRSSLLIYYADMEGAYPSVLSALTVNAKYMSVIPPAKTPDYHPDSSAENDGTALQFSDAGGWQYNNVAGDAAEGSLWINCTHTDTKGSAWSAY